MVPGYYSMTWVGEEETLNLHLYEGIRTCSGGKTY